MPLFLNNKNNLRETITPIVAQRIGLYCVCFGILVPRYHRSERKFGETGMISFIGIAQLAPGFLAALYWRNATSKGVMAGLSLGFILWLTAFGVPRWLGSRSDEILLLMYSNNGLLLPTLRSFP